MSQPNQSVDIENLPFEQALAELENIVKKLEQGSIELESAINMYSRGMLLKEHCQKILEKAKMQVDKIVLDSGKPASLETFEG